MQEASPQPDPDTSIIGLNERTAASLLRLGVVGEMSLIDHLLDRLTHADGPGWFVVMLARCEKVDGLPRPRTPELEGLSQEQWRTLKQKAKALASGAISDEERLRGTAMYLVTAAGALACHGLKISSQPDTVLRPILLDLSELAPTPWGELFRSAVERLDRTG